MKRLLDFLVLESVKADARTELGSMWFHYDLGTGKVKAFTPDELADVLAESVAKRIKDNER